MLLGHCSKVLEASNILNKSNSPSRQAAGNPALGFMLLHGQREIKVWTVEGKTPPISGWQTVKGR